MKAEDFKNMVREIIREELSSLVQEQAEQWWLKPAEAEVDAHLKPSMVHEDEYDRTRDAKLDRNPTWGSGARYNVRRADPPDKQKNAVLDQKVKYKDEDGKEHEATVSSLLRYDKNHPGRKIAARIYAQFMGKRKAADAALTKKVDAAMAAKYGKKTSEQVCEGEGCLDEKSVPQPYNRKSPPRRPMSKSQIDKRKRIGRDMMSNEKIVSKFRKKHGDEWKDYLWAAATSATFRQGGSNRGDDKK